MTKKIEALLSGVGLIFGSYNELEKPKNNVSTFKSDSNSLKNDWSKIGKDMYRGISGYESASKGNDIK
ncbi:MAG: hypothetical protein ACRCSK_04715 [Fusobacteriaceae bacterium]